MNGLIQTLSDILNNYGLRQEFAIRACFYSLAVLACIFGLGVVTLRNIFHCAISLAMTLFCIAGIYLFLNAEFLAAVQVLIYVGAIVTLFLFTIMLTAKIGDRSIRQTNKQVLASLAVSAAILSLFVSIIIGSPWKKAAADDTLRLGIGELGKALMSVYALPFEAISLILLAALVGAIVIGKAGK
jgi:NADH-quinone oxidoreductase subunit J